MNRFIFACKAFLNAFKNLQNEHRLLEVKTVSESSAHLALLTLLQSESRLIDFLKEDISSFSNEEVGKAVREIHASSAKSLEQYVSLRPVMSNPEGTKVTVPDGYDRDAIKVVGKVKGNAPYVGILRHHGWKAEKTKLPHLNKTNEAVVCPAEVEVL